MSFRIAIGKIEQRSFQKNKSVTFFTSKYNILNDDFNTCIEYVIRLDSTMVLEERCQVSHARCP